jgi:hypothetical protein
MARETVGWDRRVRAAMIRVEVRMIFWWREWGCCSWACLEREA